MTATYLPNPLNEYSTYSYNISITQINPQSVIGDSVSGGILIADNSKSSRFNIEFCEQTLVLGHDTVRSSFANRFDLKITEPNGTTFFDVLKNAAVSNNIPNLPQAAYLIEITFPARDMDNRPTKFSNTFKYVVIFSDVVAHIDQGGSYYNITAIEIHSTAYNYIQGVSKSTITFAASTVGEAIDELQKQLNLAEEANFLLDLNSSTWNEYVFEFDSESGSDQWRNWRIEALDNESDARFYSREGGRQQFLLTSGSNLHEFIGAILRTTDEWKRLPTAGGGYSLETGGEPSQAGSETRLKQFYKVVTEIRYGEYDVLKNDYKKTIKFKIKSHIVGDIPSDSNEQTRILNSPELQRTKVREYASRGLLRKKYDYLYTGKNTEVLNLDLKFEMTYFLISPIAGGQIDQDRLANNNARNVASVRDRVRSIKQEIVSNERARTILSADGDRALAQAAGRRTNDLLSILINERNAVPGMITPRYQQANVGNHTGYSSENDTVGAARLHNAAIIANLENTSDLLTIEMHIRGDPYWLGRPNNFNNLQTGTSHIVANYDLGGNLFFLKVNLPTPDEDSNGRRIPQRDNVITGLYRVINVINQFRNGQFTQYLKAIREHTINSENIPETLNVPEVREDQRPTNTPSQPNRTTPAPVSTSGTNTTTPAIPTNTTVAEAATQSTNIDFTNPQTPILLGTFSNERALVRLPTGTNSVVEVGSVLDGSTVSNIGSNGITLSDGRTLTIPGN